MLARISIGTMLLTVFLALSTQAQGIGQHGTAEPINVALAGGQTVMAVSDGANYAVYITGVYSFAATSSNPAIWLPPDGNGELGHAGPEPALPFGSIYAKIGGGPAFLIGSRRTFVANGSGNLQLYVNDNNHADNVGTLVAFIYTDGGTP